MNTRAILKNIYFVLRQSVLYFFPGRIKKADFKTQEISSILVIRIDRIGDVVASLPALKALRQSFPSAKISVLARKEITALLGSLPYIDEVIAYQGFFRAVSGLKQKQFALAIDFLMDYPVKTALLANFSKARFCAGFDIKGRGLFFDLKIKPAAEKKHVSAYILDLVKEISGTRLAKDSFPEVFDALIPIPQKNKEEISSFLKKQGIQEGDFLVGIHPGGHFPAQRWPIERFAQLADRIIERYKARVIVVGSAGEHRLVDRMIALMKERAIRVIGIPLDKLAAFVSFTQLFICNNSGPLHIACVLNIPTVSTMGPTDPVLWRPIGENQIVVRKGLACSPCNKAKCRKHECLRLISVEDMLEALAAQKNVS